MCKDRNIVPITAPECCHGLHIDFGEASGSILSESNGRLQETVLMTRPSNVRNSPWWRMNIMSRSTFSHISFF